MTLVMLAMGTRASGFFWYSTSPVSWAMRIASLAGTSKEGMAKRPSGACCGWAAVGWASSPPPAANTLPAPAASRQSSRKIAVILLNRVMVRNLPFLCSYPNLYVPPR